MLVIPQYDKYIGMLMCDTEYYVTETFINSKHIQLRKGLYKHRGDIFTVNIILSINT